MADNDDPDWKTAIDAALARNASRAGKPATLRKLASVLGSSPGSTQKADSWKRTIGKIRAGDGPSEPHAVLIAKALGVSRDSLPPAAAPLKPSEVFARLEELGASLEAVMAEQESLDGRLAALEVQGEPVGDEPTDQAVEPQ